MTDIVGYAQFVASKVGKTGLTPTVDVFRITRSTGASSQIVTAQNATEVAHGGYSYQVTGADLTLYDYLFVFVTADATVDQQEILSLWTNYGIAYATEMGRIDVAVSTRLADASYTAPLTAGQTADAVLDALSADHNDPNTIGELINDISGLMEATSYVAPLTAGQTADAVLDALAANHDDPNTIGELINDISALSVTAFPAGAITYTYTVTDNVSFLPIEGVDVWFATDNAFANIVWRGMTDVFGVARDVNNDLPKLDAGTYYIRLQKTGYSFSDDTEIVS